MNNSNFSVFFPIFILYGMWINSLVFFSEIRTFLRIQCSKYFQLIAIAFLYLIHLNFEKIPYRENRWTAHFWNFDFFCVLYKVQDFFSIFLHFLESINVYIKLQFQSSNFCSRRYAHWYFCIRKMFSFVLDSRISISLFILKLL